MINKHTLKLFKKHFISGSGYSLIKKKKKTRVTRQTHYLIISTHVKGLFLM